MSIKNYLTHFENIDFDSEQFIVLSIIVLLIFFLFKKLQTKILGITILILLSYYIAHFTL